MPTGPNSYDSNLAHWTYSSGGGNHFHYSRKNVGIHRYCDTVAYSYVGIYMRQASTYRAVTYLKQVPSSFLLFPLHTDGGREKILHHASSCFLSIELLLRSIQFEIWREKKDYRTFLFFLSQTVYLLSTYHKQLFLRGSNSSVSDLQP